MPELSHVLEARQRIAPYITRTPLLRVPALDGPLGCQVYLKHEGFQPIGAFKLRGAMNKLLSLREEERQAGVVCASSGNHAQGVAWAARRLGCKAVIVMPTDVSSVKLAGVKALGGEVVLEGTLSTQRLALAARLVAERGMVDVHPYADLHVSAGQGTIGLEILEDLPDVTAVAVPIGGGGLISGVATALKGTAPGVRTIGVEPAGAPRYAASRSAGAPVTLERVSTIADGTRTDAAHPMNFPIIEERVDFLTAAGDRDIEKAMYLLMTVAKLVAEPSGALPVAAALAGALPVGREDKVVFVLSGGNAEAALLARVLERGMD